jgi:hypothetical protein
MHAQFTRQGLGLVDEVAAGVAVPVDLLPARHADTGVADHACRALGTGYHTMGARPAVRGHALIEYSVLTNRSNPALRVHRFFHHPPRPGPSGVTRSGDGRRPIRRHADKRTRPAVHRARHPSLWSGLVGPLGLVEAVVNRGPGESNR